MESGGKIQIKESKGLREKWTYDIKDENLLKISA